MEEYVYLKSGDQHAKVLLSDIVYAKAERKYVRIVTVNTTYFIRCSITCLHETSLGQAQFCRIHKSYLVSLGRITGFDKKSVFIGKQIIPIGRHFKEQMLRRLHTYGADVMSRPTHFNGNVDSLLESIEP